MDTGAILATLVAIIGTLVICAVAFWKNIFPPKR